MATLRSAVPFVGDGRRKRRGWSASLMSLMSLMNPNALGAFGHIERDPHADQLPFYLDREVVLDGERGKVVLH